MRLVEVLGIVAGHPCQIRVLGHRHLDEEATCHKVRVEQIAWNYNASLEIHHDQEVLHSHRVADVPLEGHRSH